MPRNFKNFDYQLDLTPFISLLSVCICFLLLTVAWFQIGSLPVKQVMGGVAGEDIKEEASLWIRIQGTNKMELSLKKGQASLSKNITLSATEEGFDFNSLKKNILNLKKQQSNLNKVFIFPQEQAVYEDIVKVMDSARQLGLFNIGLAPI